MYPEAGIAALDEASDEKYRTDDDRNRTDAHPCDPHSFGDERSPPCLRPPLDERLWATPSRSRFGRDTPPHEDESDTGRYQQERHFEGKLAHT
jgi:hypothetical protein